MTEPTPPAFLDWRNAKHNSSRLAKCRCCEKPTYLGDDNGKACHKTCAEDEATRYAAAVAARNRRVAAAHGTAGEQS